MASVRSLDADERSSFLDLARMTPRGHGGVERLLTLAMRTLLLALTTESDAILMRRLLRRRMDSWGDSSGSSSGTGLAGGMASCEGGGCGRGATTYMFTGRPPNLNDRSVAAQLIEVVVENAPRLHFLWR